jgi:hypothetical protein
MTTSQGSWSVQVIDHGMSDHEQGHVAEARVSDADGEACSIRVVAPRRVPGGPSIREDALREAALIVARERAETWIRAAPQTRESTQHYVVTDALSRPPRWQQATAPDSVG